MANCTYCNQPAGFFHHSHPECREQAQSVYAKIREVVFDYVVAGTSPLASPAEVAKTTLLKLEDQEIRKSILAAFTRAIDHVLEDGLLSQEAEDRAVAVIDKCKLTEQEIDAHGLRTKLAKSAVLRDLTNGVIPHRFNLTGFNLISSKGESVIWGFQNVHIRELKKHREYRGGSHGYSIRIVKGVYYRVSGFRGVPVETQSYDSIGFGTLVITNKNLFLVLATRTFKIPLAKLISVTPYLDGIGFQRDTVRDSSFLCANIDGWFAYNVVSNLASL